MNKTNQIWRTAVLILIAYLCSKDFARDVGKEDADLWTWIAGWVFIGFVFLLTWGFYKLFRGDDDD